MQKQKLVIYRRVSTDKQGRSGLGLEAQQSAVDAYVAAVQGSVLGEYTEVESGSRNGRRELMKALKQCRLTNATLVIAKLDRLSRNAAFLLSLQESGVRFVAADMPQANNLTIGIMALVAQQEREAISKRTKEALAAAKTRGVRLGNPNGAAALRRAGRGNQAGTKAASHLAQARAQGLKEVIEDLRSQGATTLAAVADGLNARSMPSPRGGKWGRSSVSLLLARLG
ncbi:recombinase family protein [Pseudoxanthomonas sacheonensis]|uniref:recombinase family protein n=1 Tax=Pseudoxanthomonas sacheonensis TaxID=443615 RepID=UPI0013D5247B|nr:recombinase family protein [Pseudoxanthomonas sacheonensis]KAF1711687.1 resolvase [Pseudoxanthomonas sacheonensis]